MGEINRGLHELSQPLTVLFCSLELGVESEEMRGVAMDACEQMRRTLLKMQAVVREAASGA